jgi:transposase-like protein
VALDLKYSLSTALTVSGMDSSFRAFRSCSSAFTISSDMATIILFIKVDALPLYSYSNLYRFWVCIAMCSDWNMATAIITRQERGRMIAEQPNQIQRMDERSYKVTSQSGNGTYDVVRTEKFAMRWICNCPDWTYRQVKCKHIWAVEFSQALRNKVKQNVVIEPLSPSVCPYCTGTKLVRHGLRHNRYGDLQRFSCRTCGKRFTQNLGFEHMGANPQSITSAMQLYFTGESLRNVQKFLRLQGVEVDHTTIYRWIKKYTEIMDKYLEQMQPQVGNTWRADELFLKVRGDMKYLYALMDDETRFWIAKEVADTKYHANVHDLFKLGRKITGKAPFHIITDGAPNFYSGIEKEFWREKKQLALVHEQDIRFDGKIHNNKMERMNGEIRDREKVVRGVKREDSPLISGLQIYHNYVRPHMALDGKTPAEVAGIKVQGENKWITLIQNARKKETN